MTAVSNRAGRALESGGPPPHPGYRLETCATALESVWFLLTASLFLACSVLADIVPLGHPDFYPSPERPVGLRGDGSGVFAGATPVLEFGDGTTCVDARQRIYERDKNARPKNILWRAKLPNWSNSSPIVVGKRVFLMAEPTNTAPILLCLDAVTGKILWQREVDHLDLLSEPEKSEIKKLWSDALGKCRQTLRLWSENRRLEARRPKVKKAKGPKMAPLDLMDEDTTELDDLELEEKKPEKEGPPDPLAGIKNPALRKEFKAHYTRCKKLGITGFKGKSGWGWVPAQGLQPLSRDDMQKLEKYGCYFHKWELGLFKGGVQIATYVFFYADRWTGYCMAGDHVFAIESIRGRDVAVISICDLDGSLVKQNYLGCPPETPEEVDRIRAETGYDTWAKHDRYTGSFHSAPFFAGSRMYVRSRSDLICIGEPK